MKTISNKKYTSNSAVPTEIGITEWFRAGDYEHVERILLDIEKLGIKSLRTNFDWSLWKTSAGRKWYDWLIPVLSSKTSILLCFCYSHPANGIVADKEYSGDLGEYEEGLSTMLGFYGEKFEWLEIWDEPNMISDWGWSFNQHADRYGHFLKKSIGFAYDAGKKIVIGGSCSGYPNWLTELCRENLLDRVHAIGVHCFPGRYGLRWEGWETEISKVKDVLGWHGCDNPVWVTETGYPTWKYEDYKQLAHFAELQCSNIERGWWYSAEDISISNIRYNGFYLDETLLHFGLKKQDMSPKLLYKVLEREGMEGVLYYSGQKKPSVSKKPKSDKSKKATKSSANQKPVLITGGAGFIGTNLAESFLSNGTPVILFDNLSRPGVEQNLKWLTGNYGNGLEVRIADIRDYASVKEAVKSSSIVYHFAAQVAVTTSVSDPVSDFDINVRGTLNILEAARAMDGQVPVVFTSTNKVYGPLDDIELDRNERRYEPLDQFMKLNGIHEGRPLDFYCPYGCSKGAADQYVTDYARVYGIPAVVFRMSCIYGKHQFGTEDQGWVAYFLIQSMKKRPITIYGDGRQVRDILSVNDLIRAFHLSRDKMDTVKGKAFNIGGGSENTVSLLELLDIISELNIEHPEIEYGPWRKGDQKYYVSDIGSFTDATGWAPEIHVREGVDELYNWLRDKKSPVMQSSFIGVGV